LEVYYKKKENEIISFEKVKEEEIKKLEKERKFQLRNINRNTQKENQNKKEREEIELLRGQLSKLHDEMRIKQQKNRIAIEKIKKQLDETNRNNEALSEKIKYYENMRIKNMNQKRNSFNKNKNIINQININNNNQFWEKNEEQKNKNNSNYNNNYDTNTNNISKNKFKNEKKNDIYDIVFLPKYHSP
jgi:centromere protein J